MRSTNLIQKILFIMVFILLSVNSVFLSAEDNGDLQGEGVIYPPQEERLISPEMSQQGNKEETPQYVPNQLIVKLKEGQTVEAINDLNEKYNVSSVERVFHDTANPQDALDEFKKKLSELETEKHHGWYWQLDKDSQEYKDYIAKIEKEKEELKKQIQAQEELIAHLEQRQKRAPEGAEAPNLENTYILKTAENTNVQEMVQEYSANPNVEYAEPNYIVKIQMVPNDPYYSSKGSWGQDYDDLWGLKKIEAEKAWDISQGEGVIVAVVDTGIDYNHEDIFGNIWINIREQIGDANGDGFPGIKGVDDDGDGLIDEDTQGLQPGKQGYINDLRDDDDENGYVDDVRGWDFVGKDVNNLKQDNDPMDGFGHGTHVAGTIAAVGNNNKGVIGVAPKVKVMTVKGSDDTGSASFSALADCLRYAADKGADVINNSWGEWGSSQVITDAVNYAYAKGCVVVAAAANSNMDAVCFFPGNIVNVITVAAFDPDDRKCSFSNYGTKIDVTAPGSYILSTVNDNGQLAKGNPNLKVSLGYYRLDGTSMACPHVAGVAALVLAKTPGFNVEQVRYVLRNSADDVESSGWDINSGYGRINAYKALQITSASKAIASITLPVSGSVIKNKINIEGRATGVSYKIEYAKDIAPYVYTLIGSGSKVDSGMLASWDTTSIIEDGNYILKLTVTDASKLVVETRSRIILDNKNLFISSLLNNDILRAGDKISISGNAKGAGFQSYIIEYSRDKSNWSVIKQGNSAVDNDVFAIWDTSFITTAGTYHIKLTGYYSGGKKVETLVENLYFDPTLHPGWPQRIYTDTEYIWNSFYYPTITDLNADGNKEIIVSYDGIVPKIAILKADGQLERLIVLPDNMRRGCLRAPAIGDVNNDGFDEIVVTAMKKDDYTLWVFVYKYDGTLVSGWPVQVGQVTMCNSVVLSDLNKDGNLELIVMDGYGRLYVTDNKGKIVLGPIQIEADMGYIVYPTSAVGNFDEDKELEIVVIGNKESAEGSWIVYIHVFNLDGTEVNGWPKHSNNQSLIILSSPAIGDIDGDGNPDIVIGVMDYQYQRERNAGGIYVFNRYGNILSGWPILTTENFSSSPALADFDNDGKLEVVIGSSNWTVSDSNVYVIDYTGKILPGWPQIGGDSYSSIIGDFNADGKLDIISFSGNSILVRNYDGTYIPGFSKKVEQVGRGGVVGDIDNDGKLEFIASSVDYDEIRHEDKGRASVYVWDIDAKYNPQYDVWPTFQHDNQRTGNYRLMQDTTAPLGSIKIINPTGYSNRVVSLSLSATDIGIGMGEGARMQFSNDGLTWSAAYPYSTTKTWVLPFIGDVDGSGKIIAYDALLALKHSVGKIKLTGDQFLRADVNQDGKVTSIDAKYINSLAVGKTREQLGLSAGVKYTVYAKFKDAAGNWSESVSDSISVIVDVNVPVIKHTAITSASKNKDIVFRARVTDSLSGVESVTLYWKKGIKRGDGWTWTNIRNDQMVYEGGNVYKTTLSSSQTENRNIKYYLSSKDKAGNIARTQEYEIKR